MRQGVEDVNEGPSGGEELEKLRRRGATVVEDGLAEADHIAPAVPASSPGLNADLRREVARLAACFPRLVEGVGVDGCRRRPVVDEGDHSALEGAK